MRDTPKMAWQARIQGNRPNDPKRLGKKGYRRFSRKEKLNGMA
jgi:hypothetical protein